MLKLRFDWYITFGSIYTKLEDFVNLDSYLVLHGLKTGNSGYSGLGVWGGESKQTNIWPKIQENRNNRKISFHSTIPFRASFSRPREPVIMLVINKSDTPCAVVRFCYHFYQNRLKPRSQGLSSSRPIERGKDPENVVDRITLFTVNLSDLHHNKS